MKTTIAAIDFSKVSETSAPFAIGVAKNQIQKSSFPHAHD